MKIKKCQKIWSLVLLIIIGCTGRIDDANTEEVDDLSQLISFNKISAHLETNSYNRPILELEFEIKNNGSEDVLALSGEIAVTNLLGEYVAFYDVTHQDTVRSRQKVKIKLKTRFDPEGKSKVDKSTSEKLKFYWNPEKVVLTNGKAFIENKFF
ncbi:MAG: hypothetical protein ABJF04_19665 [Reichenbachiella sp.]|uniref:hypothetical protein n=1 Tax=Reichenbachiella sp. TaxID=2184521 RepID=UPI0032674B37